MFVAVFFGLLLSALNAQKEEKTVQEQLDELRAEVQELREERETVTEEEESTVKIHGYLDLEYSDFSTSKSTLNPLISDISTFSNSHLNLSFDADLEEDLRVFAEIRFLNSKRQFDSGLGVMTEENIKDNKLGGVIIERARLDHKISDQLNFRVGKFLTPYGIWNVDHGSPVLLSTRTPLLIRKNIFPEAITGLQSFGRVDLGGLPTNWFLWIGNGKGAESDLQDDNHDKSFGARLRFDLPTPGNVRSFKLGISHYQGEVRQAEFQPNATTNPAGVTLMGVFAAENAHSVEHRDQMIAAGFTLRGEALHNYSDNALGVDLELELSDFKFQGEWVTNHVKYNPLTTSQTLNKRAFVESGWYAQLAYSFQTEKFGKVSPFYRCGLSDPNNRFKNEIGEMTIHTYGVNVRYRPRYIMKFEYHDHHFHENARNFKLFTSSLTVAF
jgi:hypothetical protein